MNIGKPRVIWNYFHVFRIFTDEEESEDYDLVSNYKIFLRYMFQRVLFLLNISSDINETFIKSVPLVGVPKRKKSDPKLTIEGPI